MMMHHLVRTVAVSALALAASLMTPTAAAQPIGNSGDAFPEPAPSAEPFAFSRPLGTFDRRPIIQVSGASSSGTVVGFMVLNAAGGLIDLRFGNTFAQSTGGSTADGTYFIAPFRAAANPSFAGAYRINSGGIANPPVELRLFDQFTGAPRGTFTGLSGEVSYFSFVVDQPSVTERLPTVSARSAIRFLNPESNPWYAVFSSGGSVLTTSRIINEETDLQSTNSRVFSPGRYFIGAAGEVLSSPFSGGFRVTPLSRRGTRNYEINIDTEDGPSTPFISGTLRNAGFQFYSFNVRDESVVPDLGTIGVAGERFQLVVSVVSTARLALYRTDGTKIEEGSRDIILSGGLAAGTYELAIASGDATFVDGFLTIVDGSSSASGYTVFLNGESITSDTLEVDDDVDFFRFTIAPPPCSPADLADPIGQLTQADLDAFDAAFTARDALAAVFAPPTETTDAFDQAVFAEEFATPCP